jgi:hypothetical protein
MKSTWPSLLTIKAATAPAALKNSVNPHAAQRNGPASGGSAGATEAPQRGQ